MKNASPKSVLALLVGLACSVGAEAESQAGVLFGNSGTACKEMKSIFYNGGDGTCVSRSIYGVQNDCSTSNTTVDTRVTCPITIWNPYDKITWHAGYWNVAFHAWVYDRSPSADVSCSLIWTWPGGNNWVYSTRRANQPCRAGSSSTFRSSPTPSSIVSGSRRRARR
jgi:hypothetical protein